MAIPTSKAELLGAIDTSFERLMHDFRRVQISRARERSLPGHVAGTLISPADLVAYLIGWNELVLTWLEQDDRGETVEFPAPGFKWNQLGPLAQSFYEQMQNGEWAALLDRLVTAKAQLVQTISARSDEELYHSLWYGKWTKGRMIQFNTSSPYTNARGRIRKWLSAPQSGTSM